jgi:hypothetical protein
MVYISSPPLDLLEVPRFTAVHNCFTALGASGVCCMSVIVSALTSRTLMINCLQLLTSFSEIDKRCYYLVSIRFLPPAFLIYLGVVWMVALDTSSFLY